MLLYFNFFKYVTSKKWFSRTLFFTCFPLRIRLSAFWSRLPGGLLIPLKSIKNRWFLTKSAVKHGCGDRTWTCGLRVMSPTSYQLLYPAIFIFSLRQRSFTSECLYIISCRVQIVNRYFKKILLFLFTPSVRLLSCPSPKRQSRDRFFPRISAILSISCSQSSSLPSVWRKPVLISLTKAAPMSI